MHMAPGTHDGMDVGDGIKMGGAFPNGYVAGNLSDPSKDYLPDFSGSVGLDWWKAPLLISAIMGTGSNGWELKIDGMTVEYNTLRHPPPGSTGGASVYWNTQPESNLRYNLLDNTNMGQYQATCPLAMTSQVEQLTQDPVRIHSNHLIKGSSDFWIYHGTNDHLLDASNLKFDTWALYQTFLETNDALGSDIDPDNFWGGYTP